METLRLPPDLEIRQRQPEDADKLFSLVEANRGYLRKWLPWLDQCVSVEDTRRNIEDGLRAGKAGLALAAALWREDEVVGVISFNRIDRGIHEASIGYWLAEAWQGRGWMTRAVAAWVDHGFTSLGLQRQTISCAVDNRRSRAIPERLGFPSEGTLPDAEWLYDRYVDHVRYAISREEWLEKKSSSARGFEA